MHVSLVQLQLPYPSHVDPISRRLSSTAAFKAAVAIAPAAIAGPAFAADSIIASLPTNTVALEVQFGAYLAVLFGTFLPCLFLINLFIQTESRKAGKAGGQDSD
jgi:photosystem II PsbM protein